MFSIGLLIGIMPLGLFGALLNSPSAAMIGFGLQILGLLIVLVANPT